jgi:hypothetical protein
MFHELSKREKKIAKACIDKGLEAEFKEGLENFHGSCRTGEQNSNLIRKLIISYLMP